MAMYRSHAIIVRWISEQNDKPNISIEITESIKAEQALFDREVTVQLKQIGGLQYHL